MMVSDDGGQTWKQLSRPAYGTALHLSPDGREPWVVSRHRMYQLVGDGWILRHTLSTRDDAQRLALLGDGLWFGRLEAGLGYLKDGVFTAESRLPAGSEAGVLADGTIVVPTDGGAFLGVGTGTDRQWIRVAT